MLRLGSLGALFRGPQLHLLPYRTDEPETPRRVPDPRWLALTGLLITLLLVLGGIFLIHELGRAARLQDCVMSGRTN
jgi:hypothetical protein